MDLSGRDLESFFSFLTIKARNKYYVVESYEAAESNLTELDSKLIGDGKTTSPNLLVFGAKEVEAFNMVLSNKPMYVIVKELIERFIITLMRYI
jgi:hypothetical protein